MAEVGSRTVVVVISGVAVVIAVVVVVKTAILDHSETKMGKTAGGGGAWKRRICSADGRRRFVCLECL